MRRFTRLTNAFSKKVENHAAAIALNFMRYNFGRGHQTLRVTPAMEAGVANHVWSVEEIVGLLEENGEAMKWTPRRILLHVIIVLVTLALPLLLPSSCGPAVHSEASLTAGISN